LFILAKLAWDTAQVERRSGIDHRAEEMSDAERLQPRAASVPRQHGATSPVRL